MNKKLILGVIFIVVIVSGIFIWRERREDGDENKFLVYKTEAECEKATGRQCQAGGCDYKCPKGKYWKGWVATSKKISDRETCVDSDGGKNIYAKGSATTKAGNQTIHINSDSCAYQAINNTSNEIEYYESLKCAGDYRHSCYVSEGYCKEYQGSLIDAQEFIQCPNGCSDGVCLSNGENISACEKAGGRINRLAECDGTSSEVCEFSSGENCYADQVKNGKCEGVFSPKVFCDGVSQSDADISAWQIYRNEKHGFELKYPNNYYITDEGDWGDENSLDIKHYIDISKYKVAPEREYDGIRIIISNFSGNFENYIDEIINSIKSMDENDKVYYESSGGKYTKEKIKINNVSGYLIGNNYYIAKNSKIFSINNGIDKKLFNQVLSTFKFINNTENKEISCTDEQRKTDVCAEIYAPVCATVEIQCIKAPCYPIQKTVPNACEACKNSLVKSYIEGECPVKN